MEGYYKLLVRTALGVPSESADVIHRLVEGTQLVEFGEGALHQFGVLTE